MTETCAPPPNAASGTWRFLGWRWVAEAVPPVSAPEPPTLPDKFTVTVERGEVGFWYATSDLHRGLLVAEPDPARALSMVLVAYADLMRASTPPGPDERGA